MYLSRLTLNSSRMAVLWVSNPYRVHQRLRMACGDDPHLLFRIEENTQGVIQILFQSENEPDGKEAFDDFPVLLHPMECKPFMPQLKAGASYRFRLLANPTVKKTIARGGEQKKARLGLLNENAQQDWLQRKIEAAGSKVLASRTLPRGFHHSRKNPAIDENHQTHLAVLFEGLLQVNDASLLQVALETGIGSAKGYGFGLLSLAPACG
jgi:CRISPR system Cascade subunit CasE